MNRFRKFVYLVTAGLLTYVAPAASGSALELLNGEDRLIVVNGYSTSFDWPDLLQRKLDRYFEGKRIVEVVSATQAGSPIARWINLDTGEPRSPWEKITQALQARGDRPVIVLGQQSLQWVFGDRDAGIQSDEDAERIRQGASAIRTYVDLLHSSGADLVFVAMHIYKHPMEPEIGHERLALNLFAEAAPAGFSPGPDVWNPTKLLYPWGFAEDRVHPGDAANAVLAHYWFETLCQFDGIEVPDWSREEMQRAIDEARVP